MTSKEKFTGFNYLERVLSDKYPEHDAIHVDDKEELYVSEYHALKAVQVERNYQADLRDSQSGWVDCLERLPEESGRYWCYVESISELGISHEQVNCSYSERHGFMENMKSVNVTHWQPLAKKP